MDLATRVDPLLRQGIESGALPGVVAMVMQGDATVYAGAFGRRSLDRPEAMSLDTVAWIASMTKPLTTALALRLVESGRLALDEPARRWLPALGELAVLTGFDAGGEPLARPPAAPVTLRQLLDHTSGFGYEFWNPALLRYRKLRKLPAIGSCQRAALDLPLLFDPGTGWEYGIGTDWAGLLIESATGQRLEDAMREHLLDPLGMEETRFAPGPVLRARLARIHQRGQDGRLAATDITVPDDAPLQMGGSGLHATASDYLRFLRMILRRGLAADGTRVLAPASVEAMTSDQISPLRIHAQQTAMPWLALRLDFFPELDKTFGLGFQLNREAVPGGPGAGSLMWAGLANTYFWADPACDLAGVFLAQVLPFADERTSAVFFDFQRAVYAALASA